MVYLSLGSNMGDRWANLRSALRELDTRVGHIELLSSVYETTPWGFHSDNNFLNLCVGLRTDLTPNGLLNETQQIERELGRTEKTEDGEYHDRLIDIDILLVGNHRIIRRRLSVPHPQMTKRPFVMVPLAQIAPQQRVPGTRRTVGELLADLPDDSTYQLIPVEWPA